MSKIAENISHGGLFKVEASADNDELNGNSSDLTLATVFLGLEVEIQEYIDGQLRLLFEEETEARLYPMKSPALPDC